MIHRSRLLLFHGLLIAPLGIHAQADTLPGSETSVLLEPFELIHPVFDRRSTSCTELDSAVLLGYERFSLRSALQLVPGVQMDERGHGGSMRLSIRGSLLRSPYGVRGVKVYWGPFPLTLADGSTPLELLDPLLVDRVSVVRSVGQARYGAAPCGLLLATAPFNRGIGANAFGETIGGPYGYLRLAARGSASSAQAAITAGVLRQRNDGYRDQEWSARDQAFIAAQWNGGKTRSQTFLTWQHGRWGLPGSLDQQTARDFPRSARPYSTAINAHVEKRQLFGGLASTYDLGHRMNVHTVVSGHAIDKTNPYGTNAAASGYKEEAIGSVSARLSLAGGNDVGQVRLQWEAGTEAMWERDHLDERAFKNAVPDTLRISAITEVRNVDLFATLHADLPGGWSAAGSIGSEATGYDHEDLLRATTASIDRRSMVLPMLAIEKRLGPATLHLRYAESSSRPTVWELLGTTGTFNTGLRPERWREIEFGAGDQRSPGALVTTEMSAYYRTVEDLITEQQDSLGSIFINSGRARIIGVELSCRAEGEINERWSLRTIGTFALQDGVHFSASPEDTLAIAGLEAVQIAWMLRVQRTHWPYVEASWRGAFDVAANERTGERMPDISVLHLGIGMTFQWKQARIETFVHCENFLDRRYTSFVQVNDPGGRYYNPAPARSVFLGIRLGMGGRNAMK